MSEHTPKITTPNRADYWSQPWRLNSHDSTKVTWFSPMLVDLQNAKREVAALQAINADLLAALESVQWIDEGRSDTGPVLVCPACRHGPEQGHASDCIVGKAIAKAKG